jgi:hypothetical protein
VDGRDDRPRTPGPLRHARLGRAGRASSRGDGFPL